MNDKNPLRKILSVAAISTLCLTAFSGVSSAQTTTTTAGQRQPGVGGPGRGGANRAFCRQVTDSQAVIAAAKGDAIAKLDLTAKEWTKIEAEAPTEIKSKVVIVRIGFQTAAKAKTNAAVKAQAVTDAGKAITTFVTANCNRGGGAGGAGGGEGGANAAALTAYRDCLVKNGLTLPNPAAGGQPPSTVAGQTRTGGQARRGGLGQLDPSDPKVAAAMKACQSVLPAGGFGGGGGFGAGGQALRDCLAKKKITFTPGQGGTNGQPDAKTQKAIADCQAEAAKAVTTTTKKK
jgi:hypothetical protein